MTVEKFRGNTNQKTRLAGSCSIFPFSCTLAESQNDSAKQSAEAWFKQ